MPDARSPVVLHLVDIDGDVVDALTDAFAAEREVTVARGDIIAVARNVLVSPANSEGLMDGGIDRRYVEAFGRDLASRVREQILTRPESRLPVGASIAVPTGGAPVRWLVVAPTMASPERVPASSAYRALRAALRLVSSAPDLHGDWYCPGLATGVGGADPVEAAREMAEAWRDWRASWTD